MGALVSHQPRWSLATVEDPSGQNVVTWMTGDVIDGAEVVSISRSRVVLRRGDTFEYVDHAAPGAVAPLPSRALAAARPSVPARTAAAPVRGSTAELAPSLREVSPGHWRLPHDEVDRIVGNIARLGMDARIAPAFENGVASGFKLLNIRRDSLLTRLGLQRGDVIRRVNGYNLDSPEKVLEAFTALRDAPRIDIELVRGGATVRHTYSVD